MPKQDRLPKKGGAVDALKKLKQMKKREPSDKLVKIIEEVTSQLPDKKETGIAAKEVEL